MERGKGMKLHPIWDDYPDVKKSLIKVLTTIEDHVRIKDPTIREIIFNLIHSGGKHLRPAYVLLCARIGEKQDEERVIDVAAAIECFHMATLVHDDVIDRADMRRHQPTVHTRYGNKFAIYTGDYLFSLAFNLLAKHASFLSSARAKSRTSRNIGKILLGELQQLHSAYSTSVTVKDYLSRISGKTAQLFALSCYSGAIASGASEKQANIAWNMGHYIGMAFQIKDDILDYKGNKGNLGKPVLSDIKNGIYTLPLILTMSANKKELTPLLTKKDRISEQDLQMILTLIQKHGGIEKAERLMYRYTEKAIVELNKLPDGPYKKDLMRLSQTLLERQI